MTKKKKAPKAPAADKRRHFVAAYVANGMNATQAAITAGYSPKTARTQGSFLLTFVDVRAAIDLELAEQRKRISTDADQLLVRWIREYDADAAEVFHDSGELKSIHDMPKIWRQGLIAGVEVEQMFEGAGDQRAHVGNLVKVKFADRHKRGESIARHIKVQAYKDVHVHKLGDPEAELVASLMGNRIMPRPQAALPAPATPAVEPDKAPERK